MTSLALRGLWARRARTALTAFVIVLGVALVTATLALTGSINRAFDTVFADAYRGTDAVVVGEQVVADSAAGRADVPPEVLARVRAVPGVADVSGQIMDFGGSADQVPLVRTDGRPVSDGGNPTFGFGIDPSRPRFNPFRLTDGRWARGPDQVVLDEGTARTAGVTVGDGIGVVGVTGTRPVRVVGIARLGDLETIGGSTIALFDVPTAQALTGRRGVDLVSVSARPGTSPEALATRIQTVLPQGFVARTGAEQADVEKGGIQEMLDIIRWFLLGFCAVSLLAGSIVIANALSITVAQRTRELATLRMIGAGRRQVMRSVMTEAFALGLAASAVGVAAGYGLVHGMTSLFRTFGLDLPSAGVPVEASIVATAMTVGTVVTLLAALPPAMRATRVAPIAAVRAASGVTDRRRRGADIVGVTGVLVALAAVGYGLSAPDLSGGTRGLMFGLGVTGLILAVAALAPRLTPLLAALAGLPSRAAGGVAGSIAAENATRDPRRTGSAAAALMVGLSLVTFVAVLGGGLKAAEYDAVRAQLDADRVVAPAEGYGTLPAAAGTAVSRAPGVDVSSSVRSDRARAAGSEVDVTGVDPSTIGAVYRFRGEAGPDAARSLTAGAALVTRAFADDHDLATGMTFTIVTPSGRSGTVRVAGIVSPPRFDSLLGDVVLGRDQFDAWFPRPADSLTLVRLAPGADDTGLRAAVTDFPGAAVSDVDDYAALRAADLDGVLNILYVLLAVAVLVAALGLASTQALAIHERRREIGMLRAVGMTRRQTRRMVRHESVITALIGAGLGVPTGILMAAMVARALEDYGVGISPTPVLIVVVAVAAILAGIAAAARPARRAARLDVLDALAAE